MQDRLGAKCSSNRQRSKQRADILRVAHQPVPVFLSAGQGRTMLW